MIGCMADGRGEITTRELNREEVISAPTASPRAGEHVRTAVYALGNWWKAMWVRAAVLAVLWLAGLSLLHVPLAPLWALVAAAMTFVPHIGGVLSVLGPVFSILLSGHDMAGLAYVLGLYAAMVIIDQLLLQPLLMKRVTRVPIWASVLLPIALGLIIPFWGVLLAPPLLAIIYAFRKPKAQAVS